MLKLYYNDKISQQNQFFNESATAGAKLRNAPSNFRTAKLRNACASAGVKDRIAKLRNASAISKSKGGQQRQKSNKPIKATR